MVGLAQNIEIPLTTHADKTYVYVFEGNIIPRLPSAFYCILYQFFVQKAEMRRRMAEVAIYVIDREW